MTKTVSYRGLLLSLLGLGVIGMVAGGATVAFYGDVERSTGNTFTAGGVELLVDSVSNYNNMVCTDTDDDGFGDVWQPADGFTPEAGHYPATGSACDGTWEETDLEDGVHKFFNFDDLKPGDFGGDTISLHVYDNPSWGRFRVENIVDTDNTCTDPEQSAEEGACVEGSGDGEVDNYLAFTAWVDHGAIAGFQCGADGPNNAGCAADPTEGDGIYQSTEVFIIEDETFAEFESFAFAPALAAAYTAFNCTEETGDTDYGECHGFAQDGRMVASATYYVATAWDLPLLETGNDAQTDTFGADMVFEVEQHRNNPNPFAGSVATATTTDDGTDTATSTDDTATSTDDVVATTTASSTLTLSVDSSTLDIEVGVQGNFVAMVAGDTADFPNRVITVSDAAAGGSFFNGTAAGECNATTADADSEFVIGTNKGICYSNDVAGTYTVTASVLDETGGVVVGDPVDITVTVTSSTSSGGSAI